MKKNLIGLLLYRGVFRIKWPGFPLFTILFLLWVLPGGCSKEKEKEPAETTGKIQINFLHHLNGVPVKFDTLMYLNEAGNPYLINEIQYFISDVTLCKNDGSEKMISDWKDIHYVDTDIPGSMKWEVYDDIVAGNYDSLGFIFGFRDEKNISFMFVNPPERDMFWPEFLGGGYHYLKLNGKWLKPDQTIQTTPFDFHLGRGQIYYSYPDSIIGFVSNEFRVSLSQPGFVIEAGKTTELTLVMNVENWFTEPHIYDHDVYGGYIMQNQDAMEKVKENGHNVFSILTEK